MARNGFRILDSDLHIAEPADLWQRYTDSAFRHLAPIGLGRSVRDIVMVHPDGSGWGRPGQITKTGDFERPGERPEQHHGMIPPETEDRYRVHDARGWTSAVQLDAMDEEGIDVATIYPTKGLHTLAEHNMEPNLAAALARAYNNWLYEFCSLDPNRLVGVAMISPFDIDEAVAETRRAVRELGFRGIFMRANIVNDRNWYDPYYDPLWSTLEELDVPVGFHESANSGWRQSGEQFPHHMLKHVYAHPVEQMMALGAFCSSGLLERHPRLRAGFLEGNCGWLPWLLWRLDEHWEMYHGVQYPDAKLRPSEYFKRQCYVSLDCEETLVKHAIEQVGNNNIVFSTDFPHADAKFPNSSRLFLELPITDEDKRKILWDNCATFYGTAVKV